MCKTWDGMIVEGDDGMLLVCDFKHADEVFAWSVNELEMKVWKALGGELPECWHGTLTEETHVLVKGTGAKDRSCTSTDSILLMVENPEDRKDTSDT